MTRTPIAPPVDRAPRILVTGSRIWDDHELIARKLERAWKDLGRHPGTVLVSGKCPRGADRMAENHWRRTGRPLEVHPAIWRPTGAHGPVDRGAGYTRNQLMVDLGADVLLAFVANDSAGASHTIKRAIRAGIPVRRFDATVDVD